ncbi:MAG TPA: hydroxymethylbilane synthase [Candidatus Saccharimonadales bacterium]|nr:hydroxymethylbilane synthase [Candidatus Saccharimonadales bacterium]
MRRIRLGSRGSMLAIAQSTWVQQQLMRHHRDLEVEFTVIKTSGDRFIDRPIANVGGKGVFTKEIEEALLANQIDIAVHSMKDLPTELAPGLTIAAVPEREDARDVLVTRNHCALGELPSGARIGTGSLRRRAQLLYRRKDLHVTPIRGNVDTRLKKLDSAEVDALIMAAAGLKRIGREERIGEYLPDAICVSAVAQGALAIETREEDVFTRELLRLLHDSRTFAEVSAERALLARLGGGCQVPIGARARVVDEELSLIGVVASPDGSGLCRGEISGPARQPVDLGQRLADQLINQGAAQLIASV